MTLNNTGWTARIHLYMDFFSVVKTTVLHIRGWLSLGLQNCGYGGLIISYMWIFYCVFLTVWRVSTLNPCVVQGSAVVSLTGYRAGNEKFGVALQSFNNNC